MTHEQTQTETETETETQTEAETEAAARAESDDAGDDTSDDDDRAEDDKPKKVKISFEAKMPRTEAVSYFEAIVGGLRSGRLEFKQDGETLVLSPPEQLEVEVKAQRKGDKGKVVLEIAWSDEARTLEILN